MHAVLVSAADSLTQAGQWIATRGTDGRPGTDPAHVAMIGTLRAATLLADRVLLTEAQVLDGIVLLDLGPDRLAHALGVPVADLPIQVSGAAPTLAARAATMAADPAYEWSSVAALLATPGRDPDEVAADLARRRAAWVEVCDAHGLVVPRTGTFDLESALRAGAPPPDADPALVERLIGTPSRSAARSIVGDAVATKALSPDGRDRLERWWSRGYLAAIAAQHGTGWVDFSTGADEETQVGPDRLRLQGDLVDRLAEMPPSTVAGVRFDARHALATWRAAATDREREGALHDLAYVVLRACDPPRRGDARLGGVLLLVALVVGLAGLLLERVLAGSAVWGLVAAIAVTLVQGAPWDAFRSLLEVRRGRTRAVIHVAP